MRPSGAMAHHEHIGDNRVVVPELRELRMDYLSSCGRQGRYCVSSGTRCLTKTNRTCYSIFHATKAQNMFFHIPCYKSTEHVIPYSMLQKHRTCFLVYFTRNRFDARKQGAAAKKTTFRDILPVQLRLQSVTIKGKMLRIRKGAEGESARPTLSKKEKPTVSD